MSTNLSLVLPLLAVVVGCDASPPVAPGAPLGSAELVYGTDDRLEWYEVSDPALLALGDATAVLMDSSWLTSYPNGDVGIYSGYELQDYMDVCASEPYRTQPVPGDCTGFLVGDDLAVTAGHCVSNSSCSDTWFIFGFRMDGPNDLRDRVSDNDVYVCDRVVARSNTNDRDYAVVRLDRQVVGHAPLEIRRSGTVATGTPLVVSSHPVGLPLKIAGNATVRSNGNANYFGANLDVYGGSSGAPVVNASTMEVEGILVRGNDDWQWTGSCYVSNQCSNGGCPGWEDVTRTSLFESYVPQISPGAGCVEDSYESNNTVGASILVNPGLYADLAVCGGNEDWFSVPVQAGDVVDARILFANGQGDLDLAVYDAANTELGLSETITDDEAVTVTAPSDGVLYVRVYGYQGAENTYDLDIEVTGGTPSGLLALSGASQATAGSSYTFAVAGAPANDNVVVVTGRAGGATGVPGCFGLTLPASNVVVVGSVGTDGSGAGALSRTLPTSAAGTTRSFWAVSRSACEQSAALTVSIQ